MLKSVCNDYRNTNYLSNKILDNARTKKSTLDMSMESEEKLDLSDYLQGKPKSASMTQHAELTLQDISGISLDEDNFFENTHISDSYHPEFKIVKSKTAQFKQVIDRMRAEASFYEGLLAQEKLKTHALSGQLAKSQKLLIDEQEKCKKLAEMVQVHKTKITELSVNVDSHYLDVQSKRTLLQTLQIKNQKLAAKLREAEEKAKKESTGRVAVDRQVHMWEEKYVLLARENENLKVLLRAATQIQQKAEGFVEVSQQEKKMAETRAQAAERKSFNTRNDVAMVKREMENLRIERDAMCTQRDSARLKCLKLEKQCEQLQKQIDNLFGCVLRD